MYRYRENAGYYIQEVHTHRFSEREEGYVLAKKPDAEFYVTWYFLVRDGVWDYNLGHYFDNARDAEIDFHHRISMMYCG